LQASTQRCQWLLLTHTREVGKLTNTGRLLMNSLPNASVHLWRRTEPLETLLKNRRAVLLFPNEGGSNVVFSHAQQVMREQEGGVDPVLWVLLDSTWQQAKKMVRQSPELQALPRLSLNIVEGSSRYHLRRNQQGLSTLETAASVLDDLNEPAAAASLLDYLDTFQRHWEAHRSSRLLS